MKSTGKNSLQIFKKRNAGAQKLALVTAYDYPTAKIADEAGIDALLVGDSMGFTIFGEDSTLGVTIDDMVRATKSVSSASKKAFIIADMPFMSYQTSLETGMKNASRLISEGGANAVKVEGASRETLQLIHSLIENGIPVIGHLGLTPQSINTLDGYSTQGTTRKEIALLLISCETYEALGVPAVVLEYLPRELAEFITEQFMFTTIGIGSGLQCDGEVQVLHDIIGLGEMKPRHSKQYANTGDVIFKALNAYVKDVKSEEFPSKANGRSIKSKLIDDALEDLEDMYNLNYPDD